MNGSFGIDGPSRDGAEAVSPVYRRKRQVLRPISAPFQGLSFRLPLEPRALPWAGIIRPFGANSRGTYKSAEATDGSMRCRNQRYTTIESIEKAKFTSELEDGN